MLRLNRWNYPVPLPYSVEARLLLHQLNKLIDLVPGFHLVRIVLKRTFEDEDVLSADYYDEVRQTWDVSVNFDTREVLL